MRVARTSSGTKFRRALDFLHAHGVKVTKTSVYAPPLSGLFERGHGIILSLARTVLQQAKLPLGYWNYAIRQFVNCKNFVP